MIELIWLKPLSSRRPRKIFFISDGEISLVLAPHPQAEVSLSPPYLSPNTLQGDTSCPLPINPQFFMETSRSFICSHLTYNLH